MIMKIELPENELKKVIDFCDKRKYAGVTKGVLIKQKGTGAEIVATDGAILCVCEVQNANAENWPEKGVVLEFNKASEKMLNAKEARSLVLTAPEGATVMMATSAEGYVVPANILDATFPNYQIVILPDNAPEAENYEAISWDNLKKAFNVLGHFIYYTPKQQKKYGPVMWKKDNFTIVACPLRS